MIKKEVLSNGLRVILAPNQSTGVVTVMAMVGAGSRNEDERVAGISHVLEHMNYKGTEKLPTATKVAEFIESIGGEHNAFTGKEYTGFYAKVTPRHLADGMEFVSDIVLNSLLRQEDLDREKGVIIEEIKMYEDTPMDLVEDRFEEALFGHNALGRDIIGTRETVTGISRDDLLNYRASHYVGPNSVVVIAGNYGEMTEEEVIGLVQEKFIFPESAQGVITPLSLDVKKKTLINNKATEQSHLIIGFPGAAYNEKDKYILKILATILGGSMSSRMFVEIREKRGLAYAVRSSVSSYREIGSIETQVGVPHDKVQDTIKAIINEYKKIKDEPVKAEELQRAKEILSGRLLISFEDSLDVASYYALGEVLAEQIVLPDKLLAEYNKITAEDIQRIAQKYLVDDKMSLAYIGPALKESDLATIFQLK